VNEDLLGALDSIEKERGINKETLFEAIEVALISAYKRNFNHATNARVEIDRETGKIKVFRSYEVVEEVSNKNLEMDLEQAREIDSNVEIGDNVELEVTPKDFGRIAAQTAKQVVIQRIREAEREIVYDDYVDKIEEVVTGVVQRLEQKNVFIDLGKAEAILPPEEQIPYERYRQGERIKVFIVDVQKTTKGPQIIVSRAHSGLLKRLFEMEVPEISDGIIEVKSAAREAGHRSKIAVYSSNTDIDPVGACVGPKGSRVQAITNELRGEKIDIINWNEIPEGFIINALSPAKVSRVTADIESKEARVLVPDDQLSLAIGREGQNARLAAKITGWKIDIVSESQLEENEELIPFIPETKEEQNDTEKVDEDVDSAETEKEEIPDDDEITEKEEKDIDPSS